MSAILVGLPRLSVSTTSYRNLHDLAQEAVRGTVTSQKAPLAGVPVLGALHRLNTRLVGLLGGEGHLQEHHDLIFVANGQVHADNMQQDARLGELGQERRRRQHPLTRQSVGAVNDEVRSEERR